MAGKLLQFLVDTGATYFVLTSHTGPLAPETCSIIGVEGRPKRKHFTTPLPCTWGKILITHKFLVMPECPSPLLGRDFLSALGVTLTLPESQKQGMFLAGLCIIQDMDSPAQNIPPEKLIDLQVWDQGIPGKAKFVTPIKFTLKETNNFLSRQQHPIKPETPTPNLKIYQI